MDPFAPRSLTRRALGVAEACWQRIGRGPREVIVLLPLALAPYLVTATVVGTLLSPDPAGYVAGLTWLRGRFPDDLNDLERLFAAGTGWAVVMYIGIRGGRSRYGRFIDRLLS